MSIKIPAKSYEAAELASLLTNLFGEKISAIESGLYVAGSTIAKYKYVGGFYGATNHKSILRDVYDHGPVAVCFQVALGFGNYHGGVYKQPDALPIKDHFGRVNHAVLITGFGETEDGQKYWKL